MPAPQHPAGRRVFRRALPAGPATPTAPATPAEPTAYELEAYKQLATLFNSEEAAFWTRNNILVALQVGLVAALVTLLGREVKGEVALLVTGLDIVCLVGLAMASCWIFMVRRSTLIANTISDELKAIERVFSVRNAALQAEFMAYTTFGRELNPDTATVRPAFSERYRLSWIWTWVGGLFLLLWVVMCGLAFSGQVLHRGPVDTVLRSVAKAAQPAADAGSGASAPTGASAASAPVAAISAPLRTPRRRP